jgi:hypothetical protein
MMIVSEVADNIATLLLADNDTAELVVKGNTYVRWTRAELTTLIDNCLNKERKAAEHNRRGNYVATAVWNWLRRVSLVEFVPWVLDETSPGYDPMKAHEQSVRDKLLADIKHEFEVASKEIAEPTANAGYCKHLNIDPYTLECKDCGATRAERTAAP